MGYSHNVGKTEMVRAVARRLGVTPIRIDDLYTIWARIPKPHAEKQVDAKEKTKRA